MKVEPGDLIIDKNMNRTLTILSVEKIPYIGYANTNFYYDEIQYMDSKEEQGKINKVYEYELDSWNGIELIKANK
jgi:hypothetical protein